MTTQEKQSIKEKIYTERSKLSQQITLLEAKTKPVAPDCSLGRLTREEEMNEQMMNKKILNEALLKQTRLKNAEQRVEHPMFGICIECEEPIGVGRMMVRPESVRCVECAT